MFGLSNRVARQLLRSKPHATTVHDDAAADDCGGGSGSLSGHPACDAVLGTVAIGMLIPVVITAGEARRARSNGRATTRPGPTRVLFRSLDGISRCQCLDGHDPRSDFESPHPLIRAGFLYCYVMKKRLRILTVKAHNTATTQQYMMIMKYFKRKFIGHQRFHQEWIDAIKAYQHVINQS